MNNTVYENKSADAQGKKMPDKKSGCDGCPYGRNSPCIGWCTRQILAKEYLTGSEVVNMNGV